MQHADIISRLTLWEKARLLSGKSNWETYAVPKENIPSVFCSDGPHGLRKQKGAADHLGLNESVKATCFPTASCLANSWDEELLREVGSAIGTEAAAEGVDILLGPALNTKRNPLCGRNFEYYSEDAYLAGKLAAAYIRGLEHTGTTACPKHFAANSQELGRMYSDSVADERTLREAYLTGFEIAVKEGRPGAIMSSYNKINGTYANENSRLLTEVLRKDWGFDGTVITDCGGSNDIVAGVAAGSTLEMPGPVLDSAERIVRAVSSGKLSEETVDKRVDELLTIALRDRKPVEPKFEEHHALAKKAASEGIVLLKNENSLLPLSLDKKIAVIGSFAETPRFQGAGSSLVNPTFTDKPLGCYRAAGLNIIGYAAGCRRDGKADEKLLAEAAALAKQADIVLLHIGLPEVFESEGLDRTTMALPENQLELWGAVLKANQNTVVILSAGSPVELPLTDATPAVVQAYLYGQAGASAMADILTGKTSPSGKLAETYPIAWEDVPGHDDYPAAGEHALYRESLFIGYRYYDTVGKAVRFSFGHGLSYTTFAYSDLEIDENAVRFTVTNTGKYKSTEIAQLYIGKPESNIFRAKKELKGFVRMTLQPGESRRAEIVLDDKAFRYFNVKTGKFEEEGGTYWLYIGASSADIRLEGTIGRAGTNAPVPYDKEALPSYFSGHIENVSDAEFEALLGRPVPKEPTGREMLWNSPVSKLADCKSGFCRMIGKILKRKVEKAKKPDLNLLFVYRLPIRGIPKMMGAFVNIQMAEGIRMAANGRFFLSLGCIIRGFFAGRKQLKALQSNSGT